LDKFQANVEVPKKPSKPFELFRGVFRPFEKAIKQKLPMNEFTNDLLKKP